MKLTITKNEENKLLERNEIEGTIDEKTIPSRNDVKKNLAAQLNTTEDKIIIKKIENEFGRESSIFKANIYKNIEKMKETERKYMLKRNEIKKEAKEETAQAVNEAETENNEVAEQATQEPTEESKEKEKKEEPKTEKIKPEEKKKEGDEN